MKFVQFMKENMPALGIVTEKGIIDVGANAGMPRTMLDLCRNGDFDALRGLTGPMLDEKDIVYAPVVTGMEKILCIGLNYRAHALESGAEIPTQPVVFCKLPNALAAHGQDIALPDGTKEFDYEAELVLIMGDSGKIFAATCGNDLSIRDWQMATGQWLSGKTYDGFGPIGPYAVEWDALPKDAAITCRVNGELRQNSPISDLIFPAQTLVDYIMPRIPLKAGDVIFTGTPSGVVMGYPADRKNWLKPGDVVEVGIEGIGVLKNKLV